MRLTLFPTLGAAAALGLAGCEAGGEAQQAGGLETSQAPEDEGEAGALRRISMPGTAWLSVSREGYAYQTFIDPDGRYRDYRDGALVFTGTWREDTTGELCFAPDEGAGKCWSFGGPQPDGSLRVTDEDGREVILRRITYTPRVEDDAEGEDEAEADEAADGA
ncbi:MAG: hypothetical protein V2I27_05305 [Erythrobacter sp.]|nr:hypothetical protein [Erythrobacter sp.]